MSAKQFWLAALDKDGWTIGRFTADNHQLGLSLWISNGMGFCDAYEGRGPKLGLIGRIFVWRKFRRLEMSQWEKKLQEAK